MTSSGPIHHSRFPAQQGQAALLAVTTASSLAVLLRQPGLSCVMGQQWERDQSTQGPRGN